MSGKEQDEEGFLTRWSRRKRETFQTAEEGDDTGSASAEASEVQEGAPLESRDGPSEDPELAANRAAAEAVDLESLTYESDFTVFLKQGVPEALKNTALRKLWRSNPVLAVVDGLNDYDTDFRTANTMVDGFKSAWKVGRGYADKAEEVKAEMEARAAKAAEEQKAIEEERVREAQRDAVAGEDAPVDPEDGEAEQTVSEAGKQESDAAPEEAQSVAKAPRRRRMAFDVGN